MLEILQFVLSGFWVFFGTVTLLILMGVCLESICSIIMIGLSRMVRRGEPK